MALDPVELSIQTEITRNFIASDPTDLILQPKGKMPDGAGGFLNKPLAPREPQTFRLIPQSDKVPEKQTSDGTYAVPEYVILGLPSTAMKRYDRFVWDGSTWEIVQIHPSPEYEKKGDVIRVI